MVSRGAAHRVLPQSPPFLRRIALRLHADSSACMSERVGDASNRKLILVSMLPLLQQHPQLPLASPLFVCMGSMVFL